MCMIPGMYCISGDLLFMGRDTEVLGDGDWLDYYLFDVTETRNLTCHQLLSVAVICTYFIAHISRGGQEIFLRNWSVSCLLIFCVISTLAMETLGLWGIIPVGSNGSKIIIVSRNDLALDMWQAITWINDEWVNSLWPTIWWYRSESTLAQVMVCSLMAPSHIWTNADLALVRFVTFMWWQFHEISQLSIT